MMKRFVYLLVAATLLVAGLVWLAVRWHRSWRANRYRREAMAFKQIFPEETFRFVDLVRLVTTNIASDLWHASRQRSLWTSLDSIFWFRWMQFWGTYQGYRQSGPLTWQLRKTFYYPRGINATSQAAPRKVKPISYNDARENP